MLEVRFPSITSSKYTPPNNHVRLQDFAMGHRVNRTRAEQELSPQVATVSTYPSTEQNHFFSVLLDPGTEVIARLVALLPDERMCRVLVEYYVSHTYQFP